MKEERSYPVCSETEGEEKPYEGQISFFSDSGGIVDAGGDFCTIFLSL